MPSRAPQVMPMSTIDGAGLYRLMAWMSPAYPTGAFAYSHGLEYGVEAGLVTDVTTLRAWVASVIARGAGWIDSLLLAAAWRAAALDDLASLIELAELAAAWRGSAEMALESETQGRAFLAVTRAGWPHRLLDRLGAEVESVPLPVAAGTASAVQAIPLALSIQAYLQSFAGNLVSAGLRLIPLGQTDGQRIIAALEPTIAETAERALTTSIEEAGTSALMIDWCSMRHETQYSRLFRS
jgi:urease accessory protein